jgi:hypothetical protein
VVRQGVDGFRQSPNQNHASRNQRTGSRPAHATRREANCTLTSKGSTALPMAWNAVVSTGSATGGPRRQRASWCTADDGRFSNESTDASNTARCDGVNCKQHDNRVGALNDFNKGNKGFQPHRLRESSHDNRLRCGQVDTLIVRTDLRGVLTTPRSTPAQTIVQLRTLMPLNVSSATNGLPRFTTTTPAWSNSHRDFALPIWQASAPRGCTKQLM